MAGYSRKVFFLNKVIKDNKCLQKQVTDFQHTCERIKSLFEVTLRIKENVDDKVHTSNNEDISVIR